MNWEEGIRGPYCAPGTIAITSTLRLSARMPPPLEHQQCNDSDNEGDDSDGDND